MDSTASSALASGVNSAAGGNNSSDLLPPFLPLTEDASSDAISVPFQRSTTYKSRKQRYYRCRKNVARNAYAANCNFQVSEIGLFYEVEL